MAGNRREWKQTSNNSTGCFPTCWRSTQSRLARLSDGTEKKIYRAIEANPFPFPVLRTGNLISIPKIGFAKWLDDGLADACPVPQPAAPAVIEEPQNANVADHARRSPLRHSNEN